MVTQLFSNPWERLIDQLITDETERRVKAVEGAEHYGIMTAAFIDGEFVLVSDYPIDELLESALRDA